MRATVLSAGLGRVLLAGLLAAPAQAQRPVTLAEALARADRHAYGNRAARAARDLQAAERDRTLQGLLPSVKAEAGWMRTTDPMTAFGFQLRQRSVTQASFSPDRLNHPAAINNFGTGFVAEVPLINPEVWLGRRAAAAATQAAAASAQWTRNQAQLDVVQAYFGGVLMREQVSALEAGLAAAQSHVRRAQSLLEQGMVTRSDLLLAEVRTGEVEAQLLAARGGAALATRRLALAFGTPDDTALVLPAALPDPDLLTPLLRADSGVTRADVQAARLGQEAGRRDVSRATALWLPRLNSFGRLDWNTADAPFGNRASWTVGVMVSWSLFGGGNELVERRAAQARAARAAAMAEAATAQARLEHAERRNDLDVAMATLRIAARAVQQAGEAHRIVTRKYEGGLATVTELLEASALETRARVEHGAARYRVISAIAAWRVALGYDVTDLTVLDRNGN